MSLQFLLVQSWTALWPLMIGIAFGLGLERLIPAQRDQSLRLTLLNLELTIANVVVATFAMSMISPLAAKAAVSLGGGWVRIRFGESLGARVAQQFAFLFVFDFFYYWTHRLQHTWPFLWQQHKVHHATPALNAAMAAGHHWLEEPLRALSITLPMLTVFDIRPAELGVLGFVIGAWPTFKHANLRIPLGPLTPIFVGPQLHRLHHSDRPEHQDRNFAAYFPIYDVLFGTYCAPKPGEWATTGLISRERPKGLVDASLWPFLGWWAMWRGAQAYFPR